MNAAALYWTTQCCAGVLLPLVLFGQNGGSGLTVRQFAALRETVVPEGVLTWQFLTRSRD